MSIVYTTGKNHTPTKRDTLYTALRKAKHKVEVAKRRVQSLKLHHTIGLLELPKEIRLKIYRYCIPHDILRQGPRLDRCPLLFLCKKVNDEVLSVLWGEWIFCIDLTKMPAINYLRHPKLTLIEHYFTRLRFMILLIPYPDAHQNDVDVAPEPVFRLVIPRLKKLRFLCSPGKWLSEVGMIRWCRNIEQWLKCIAKFLNRDTVVEIVCDGNRRVRRVFLRNLPFGFQEPDVQCSDWRDLKFMSGLEDFDRPDVDSSRKAVAEKGRNGLLDGKSWRLTLFSSPERQGWKRL